MCTRYDEGLLKIYKYVMFTNNLMVYVWINEAISLWLHDLPRHEVPLYLSMRSIYQSFTSVRGCYSKTLFLLYALYCSVCFLIRWIMITFQRDRRWTHQNQSWIFSIIFGYLEVEFLAFPALLVDENFLTVPRLIKTVLSHLCSQVSWCFLCASCCCFFGQ